ncbi:MAG: type II secretion system F family protein [Pontimonas sp.]|nr:type II secretion system F family protein [Pontimonas sp.]
MRRWWRANALEPEEPQWALAELAVLLVAGLAPDRAWEEVALQRGPQSIPGRVWQRRREGQTLMEALRECTLDQSPGWKTVGAAWEVARISGAPLGPALSSLAEGLRDHDHTTRQVDAELAAPQATLRLVGVLPVVALLGGALGGVDTLTFLFRTTPGLVTLGVGLGLLALAWWWMRLLVLGVMRRRSPPSPHTDLFLVALGGGAAPHRALLQVNRVMAEWGLPVPASDDLKGLIALSRRAGVPLASLARAHLIHARDVENTDATRAVGALSVHLVLPLGLLVLPAFVVIAVVPLVWSMGTQGLTL